MVLSKDQKQSAEEHSIAIQAGGNVTFGITYSEARQIALDTFRANFYKLVEDAKELVDARVEEVTEKILRRLESESQNGLHKAARDPGFIDSMLCVQKEYAKSGDENLGDLLVDLLVDRSNQDQRTLHQIVLNESIHTAPKLTEGQLAILALVFLFKYTGYDCSLERSEMGKYFDHIAPFVDKVAAGYHNYQHLQFCGCATIPSSGFQTTRSLESIIKKNFQGLFQSGIEPSRLETAGLSVSPEELGIFGKCAADTSKFQINAINETHLTALLKARGITPSDPYPNHERIVGLFNESTINDYEAIKKICAEVRPYMSSVFDMWQNSIMGQVELTSVGMAIGHANIKRIAGEFADLSIWLS